MKSPARNLAVARAFSEIGNSFRYIALPLGILSIHNKADDLALAEILETLGFFASGVIAPFFIDRVLKIRALVISDLLSLLVTVIMVIGIYLQSLEILFPACFAMTFMDTFYSSSLSAVTADLTDKAVNGVSNQKNLILGFSRLQLYTLTGGLIGSVFGTKIVQAIPLWAMLALDGVTFLVSSIWIYKIANGFSQKKTNHHIKQKSSIRLFIIDSFREWKEGLFIAVSDINTMKLIASQGIVGIAHGLLSATTIGHYKTTLHVSDSLVALAQVNNRIWNFAGAFYALKNKLSPMALLILGGGLMAGGYAGMAILPFFGFIVVYGIQQFGNSLLTPTNRALCLAGVATDARGRVAAFRGLVIDAGILIGNIFALIIIKSFGTRWVFVMATLWMLIALMTYKRVKINH